MVNDGTFLRVQSFGVHALLECGVGAYILYRGGYPYESKATMAAKPARVKLTARYHGSGLVALGVLGVLVINNGDYDSELATAAAQAIATFHGLSALAAGVNFAKKRSTFKQFACNPHVYLAIAFIAGCVLRANK